ncbi:hypothetical protein IWW38_003346, partial [Coemansia aciculifera]
VLLKNLSDSCTSVNTHALSAGQQQQLKSGDVITIAGRSLRYEDSSSSSYAPPTTPPPGIVAAPQTVDCGAMRPADDRRGPVVFASGGGGPSQAQKRVPLRRRLERTGTTATTRNPDTARKLQLWDAHYSSKQSIDPDSSSDILRRESPPPGLNDQGVAEIDPFTSNDSGVGAFERMAQSVGRGSDARRDPRVAAEVDRIMGQINEMAGINKADGDYDSPVQKPKPTMQRAESAGAQSPAQFFSSLPRPPLLHSANRRATSNGNGPTTVACMSSPLKRTLSSSSHCGIRPPTTLSRPLPPAKSIDEDDSEEEVPTEPEPESDSEKEAEPENEPIATPPPVAQNQTVNGRPVLLTQASSTTRKSVRFGPALSPEVFDAGAPPSTPLRRGTPMQMAGGRTAAASSSILRRMLPPSSSGGPPVSPTLLRGLLTPRPTRRQAMHQYIASLAALTESPPPKEEEEKEEAEAALPPPVSFVPAVDIESPTALGASPADRRQRRRRSVRMAVARRRVTMDSPLKELPSVDADTSSPLVVKRRALLDSPPVKASLKRERRKTAPPGIGDFSVSMAQMAAALGEDVPAIFAAPTPKPAEQQKVAVAAPAVEEEPAEDTLTVVLPPPLGLADAMHQEQQQGEEEKEVKEAEEKAEEPSSFVVLLEQAERQARIQGTSTNDDSTSGDSLGVSSKLASLSVTTPPATPLTAAMDGTRLTATPSSARSMAKRRQTIDASDILAASHEDVDHSEPLGSVDDILAHRQRLRRIQERRRRRQTVAELNKRRSSWRGWAAGEKTNSLLSPMDSPPSSPIAQRKHVAGHMSDDTTTHTPPAEDATLVSSSPSTTTLNMYPPTAWNNNDDGDSCCAAESPTKRRRITDIVASALGISSSRSSSVELAKDPKHGLRAELQSAPAGAPVFAYPPRPVPIDAEWETIDKPEDDVKLSLPAAAAVVVAVEEENEASQQVELFAVSRPASITEVEAKVDEPAVVDELAV